MRRGLPADGAFDGPSAGAHAVLLHDDGDALVAEAVATGQHRPLGKQSDDASHSCSGKSVLGSRIKPVFKSFFEDEQLRGSISLLKSSTDLQEKCI